MSASVTLKGELRTKVGSRNARSLRSEGRLVCNLQADKDHEGMNFHICFDEFMASRRAHAHLYDLEVGGKTQSAVVRELQYDALGSGIVHVEFKPVTRGVKTESEVELVFLGQPNGVLNHGVTHIAVSCIPSLIPDEIEVNVGGMEAGSHIKASDLKLPEGVELAVPANLEIAVVSAVRGDEGAAAEGEEGAEKA
ncbi:MAG: 50S ribosomal protein L25 [Planctomycetota bacterium]